MGNKVRLAAVVCLGVALLAGASRADQRTGPAESPAGPVSQLMALTHLEPLVQVVATEGTRHGLSLEGALFPGRGGAAWARIVSRIQAPDRLAPMIRDAVADMMRPEDVFEAQAFFSSDLGQRIVVGEVDARRRLLDQAAEDEAKGGAAVLDKAGSPRMTLIEDLIDALDLISANVSGGLNANYAFYRGLAEGGGMARQLAEREMLALVMEQEAEIRASTEDWLRTYLTMAYRPLSDADLRAYVTFAQTPAGRRYNAAMFSGFGQVFEVTSYDLGRAAASFMLSEDI